MNENTTLILPVITNLREASSINGLYPAVITAGPSRREVQWAHPNHFVREFDDILDGPLAPTISDVEAMLEFAAKNQNCEILVHCHAGMSRSTATALGIAIQRGANPFDAYDALLARHPSGRMFWPNDAIIAHLERIFDISGLSEYNKRNHFLGF